MQKALITIGREFGSGGRIIGKKLAEELGVPYYDKNILDGIAKKHGYSVEMIEEDERKAKNSFFYSLASAFGAAGYGPDLLSINEKFFIAQFEYIRDLAAEGNGGVIVGRCADYVLRENDDVISIFLYADEESKVRRATEKYGLKENEVKANMDDLDRSRANYYKYHTGQQWGDRENYDLLLNTSRISEEDAVRFILQYADLRLT